MALSLSICLICACTYVPYWLTYLLLWIIQLFFFLQQCVIQISFDIYKYVFVLKFSPVQFFYMKNNAFRVIALFACLIDTFLGVIIKLEFYVCNLWTGYLFCVHRKKEYFKITFVLGYKHQINIVLYFFAGDCKRYNFHFLQNICTIVHWKKMNGQMRAMALV